MLVVKCPTCQTAVTWNADFPQRPFCSERCKLIDLGEWASETRRIPDQTPIEAALGDADLLALDEAVLHDDNQFFTN